MGVIDSTCVLGSGGSWSVGTALCAGKPMGESDLEGPIADFAGTNDDDGITPRPTNYYRLREGVERFFITDINNPAASARAQSTMLTMWDAYDNGATSREGDGIAQFNHVPGGCNVLYMDGHVQFVRLNGGIPVNTQFPDGSLAGMQDPWRPQYTMWMSQLSYWGGHG